MYDLKKSGKALDHRQFVHRIVLLPTENDKHSCTKFIKSYRTPIKRIISIITMNLLRTIQKEMLKKLL